MNIKSNLYCKFCEQKTRTENGGHYFCVNGHYIIKHITNITEPIIELIQPASTGDVEGVNIFRLNSIKGEFCDDTGKPVSDVEKDESLKPEVV